MKNLNQKGLKRSDQVRLLTRSVLDNTRIDWEFSSCGIDQQVCNMCEKSIDAYWKEGSRVGILQKKEFPHYSDCPYVYAAKLQKSLDNLDNLDNLDKGE